jgi:hypothetical protein
MADLEQAPQAIYRSGPTVVRPSVICCAVILSEVFRFILGGVP